MNTTRRFALAGGFVVLSATVAVLAYPLLPARVVTHWNAAGEPDGTMGKFVALALLPSLSALLLVVFAVIPRIDPLRENIDTFRPAYDWFVVLFSAYMFALQAGIVAFNLGYEFDFVALLVSAVAVLFYGIGRLMEHAERNWFVGIRTPWTLSDEEVWERTHALGARLFKLSAALAMIGLLFGDLAVYFVLVPALLTAVITVAYSYYLYERIDRRDGPVT